LTKELDTAPAEDKDPQLIEESGSEYADLSMMAATYFGTAREDFHKGEAEFILHSLKQIATKEELRELYANLQGFGQDKKTISKYMMNSRREYALWFLAKKEEEARGVDMSKISDFGQKVAKLPRSWVEAILSINVPKKYRYMFSGNFAKKDLKHRKWLAPWVKEHFNSSDYLRATDINTKKYEPIGEYDYSISDPGGFRTKDCGGECFKFDSTYWQTMKESQFILCPGGDAPYSFRFYESMLTGSIPIIDSYKDDWTIKGATSKGRERSSARKLLEWESESESESESEGATVMINKIKYEYKMTADYPHTYDPAVAKANLKKFIRYQTFLEGDNDPVKDGI